MQRLRKLRPVQVPFQWIGALKHWKRKCRSYGEALVPLSQDDLRTHALVIGSTGSGKTNLIHHLCAQAIQRRQSLAVLDARGDLAGAAIEFAARASIEPDLVKFFDLREKERPLGFNPLFGAGEPYYRALSVLDAVAAESDSWGVQIAETLRNAVLLLSESRSNLTVLEPLFYDPVARRELVQRAQSEPVRSFWDRYDLLTPDRQAALASPVLNKVSMLFATESLRKVFGHSEPMDIAKQLNTPGSVTLVSLAVDELHSAGWMTGSLFLSSLCREIFSRVDVPEQSRNPVLLVVDEFEHFGTREFENILAEGRRFKLSAVLAHQTLAQLGPKIRSMILGNVGVKVVFRTARHDADILNKDLAGNAKAYDLPALPTGEAILWKRGQAPIHIEVNAPLISNVGRKSTLARQFLQRLRELAPVHRTVARPVQQATIITEVNGPASRNLGDWL